MQKTAVITEKEAKAWYPKATPSVKRFLEKAFGKEFFQKKAKKKVHNRPNSYEEACKMVGEKPLKASVFNFLPKWQRARAYSQHRLEIITAAINNKHIFNWNEDSDERKWFPFFDIRGSGLIRFSHSCCYCSSYDVYSYTCEALAYKNEADSDYSATTFLEDWKNIIRNDSYQKQNYRITTKKIK